MVQRAVTSNSTTPALSVYRGTLACRQRVKRFRAPSDQTERCAVAPNSTAPALSVYPGTLACRQRVKRFRAARAAVVSSALRVTGGSIQRAVTSNSTAPALSVYRGTLAYRQRVKRFRAPSDQTERCAVTSNSTAAALSVYRGAPTLSATGSTILLPGLRAHRRGAGI
jgi:hypothetical protein